jgi:hypothetical protein
MYVDYKLMFLLKNYLYPIIHSFKYLHPIIVNFIYSFLVYH